MNDEKVILITGCSTGLGRGLAETLTDRGCKVVATARDIATLHELPVALKLPLDVTDDVSIRYCVENRVRSFRKN
jgi:NADP-dependent 3-hydroxy acid dehydrogenase YdfG